MTYFRLLFLGMLLLGLNLFSNKVEAQSCTNSNSACYQPIKSYWTYDYETSGKLYASPQAAAQDWFATTVLPQANTKCPKGCALSVYPVVYNDTYTSKYTYGAGVNVYLGGMTGHDPVSDVASVGINEIPICKNGDGYDPITLGTTFEYMCFVSHNNSSSSSVATGRTDLYQKLNGNATTPDPISFSTGGLTDYEVDYKNNSPFPIVWSRYYSWVFPLTSPTWTWNYDRTATIFTASTTSAFITLTREDQQSLILTGTRLDANSNWKWTLVPTYNTVQYSPFLATGTTDQALTTLQLKTKNNEIETYNLNTSKLTKLQDVHGNYLNFTYDNINNNLLKITDSTGRYLNISYNDPVQVVQSPTGQIDANGNPILTSYSYYSSVNNVKAGSLIFGVTDGTTTFGYGYSYSTEYNSPLLKTITHADNTITTYLYNLSNEDYLWTGTLDESGNTYQNYTYTPNESGISNTSLGVNSVDVFSRSAMPNGTALSVSVNSNGQTLGVLRPCYACIGLPKDKTIVYDTSGDPITLTDYKGNVEKRTYDTTRTLPLTITKAYGTALAQTTTYVWDANFRLPDSFTEPVQTPTGAGTKVTTYTYDSYSDLTNWTSVVTGPSYTLSKSGSATYNSFGQNLTTTDSNGNVTTYTYDAQGNLTAVTNPLNQTVTMGRYDSSGLIGWVQDPNGLTTNFNYNLRKQITSISKGCASGVGCHYETYNITYTSTALVNTITASNGTGMKYIYDTAHRLIEKDVIDTSGNVLGKDLITLDAGGTPTQDTYQNASGTVIQQKNFVADDLDRIKTFVDQEAQNFTIVRDDQNNLNSVTDPLGHGSTFLYDALNRLTTTTHTDTTTEKVVYGAGSEVTSQTDALNHSTTYVYDGFGNVVSKQSPDSGLSSYIYDLNNNLLSSTDARNRSISYTYDALNRELSETSTSGETIVNTYDNCLNGIGKLCTVTDRTGVTSFTYDLWGRVLSKIETMNGLNFNLGYAYDNSGQLTSITYPSGKILNLSYTNGNVVSLTDAGMPVLSNALYDPWGRNLGWTWNSGRQASFAYDLDGKINTMTYGSTVQTYGYDNALKINSLNQSSPAFYLNYGYDNRDRLTSSNVWGSYTYDNNSNRTGLLGSLGPFTYGISPTSNQFISLNSNSNILDLSGNITAMSGKSFIYDDWSRMRSVTNGGTETDYGVNGLGERVSKKIGTNQFYYIFAGVGQLLGVYDANGLPLDETVYLDSRPVASVRGSSLSNIYPIETDNTMTPVRVIDNTDTTVWSWEGKEPFGFSQPSGTFRFNLRFPGQWYDAESGLMTNGYRDYDPASGRYMEADPLGLSAGMNDYGYVESNVLNKSDILGLDDTFCMRDRSACGLRESGKPDYVHASIGLYIGTLSFTFTKNGSLFWGFGAAHSDPKSLLSGKVGASFTAGTMSCDTSAQDVDDFINGYSTGASMFYWVGGGYSMNNAGKAFEGGIGTPGFSLQAVEKMQRVSTIKSLSW